MEESRAERRRNRLEMARAREAGENGGDRGIARTREQRFMRERVVRIMRGRR